MLNKALKVGQLIVNAHPSDVRSLFLRYGITVEPTGKSVLDAYLVYGKPFLVELLDIGYKNQSGFSSVTGTIPTTPTLTTLEYNKLSAYEKAAYDKAAADAAKTKGTTYEGVMNWFDKSASVLTAGSGLFEAISTLFGGKKIDTGATNTSAALEAEFLNAKLEAQAAQSANNTKTYLLIGAGLLVAVLVGIMFLKRK